MAPGNTGGGEARSAARPFWGLARPEMTPSGVAPTAQMDGVTAGLKRSSFGPRRPLSARNSPS